MSGTNFERNCCRLDYFRFPAAALCASAHRAETAVAKQATGIGRYRFIPEKPDRQATIVFQNENFKNCHSESPSGDKLREESASESSKKQIPQPSASE
jgi:hypothetical protein